MEHRASDKTLEERARWLERLVPHVRGGRIVEWGCGGGFVLEFLSRRFPTSTVVGVDRDGERLARVLQRQLPNVTPVRADIARGAFRAAAFDTALFVASLHEVFSSNGIEGIERAFTTTYLVLRPGSALLVQDFLRPPPKQVELGFKNERTKERFLRFAREFRPRRIAFQEAGDGVRLDVADAVEFISKYRSRTEQDWQEEMGETHFALTEPGFRRIAERAGFVHVESVFLPKRSDWWADVENDLEVDFPPDYGWIHLVLARERP
jgi:SAM-dependent methyltransferase